MPSRKKNKAMTIGSYSSSSDDEKDGKKDGEKDDDNRELIIVKVYEIEGTDLESKLGFNPYKEGVTNRDLWEKDNFQYFIDDKNLRPKNHGRRFCYVLGDYLKIGLISFPKVNPNSIVSPGGSIRLSFGYFAESFVGRTLPNSELFDFYEPTRIEVFNSGFPVATFLYSFCYLFKGDDEGIKINNRIHIEYLLIGYKIDSISEFDIKLEN